MKISQKQTILYPLFISHYVIYLVQATNVLEVKVEISSFVKTECHVITEKITLHIMY